MGVYRITTRFDLNSEAEKRAADYLKGLKHGEGNRFVADAVLARIDRSADHALLEQIRRDIPRGGQGRSRRAYRAGTGAAGRHQCAG